jgi:hypothetical protein
LFALAIFVLTTIALDRSTDSGADGAGRNRLAAELTRRNDQ